MHVDGRELLISGICSLVGAGTPPERVAATRDLIESGCRLGDAIGSPRNQYKEALITFAALGLFFAVANAASCSRRYCYC